MNACCKFFCPLVRHHTEAPQDIIIAVKQCMPSTNYSAMKKMSCASREIYNANLRATLKSSWVFCWDSIQIGCMLYVRNVQTKLQLNIYFWGQNSYWSWGAPVSKMRTPNHIHKSWGYSVDTAILQKASITSFLTLSSRNAPQKTCHYAAEAFLLRPKPKVWQNL